ncbi:pilus assembly protein TadG-related protein [Thermanaerothrix sp. 4228-RoL]|uniref:Pilus assembly protein TadG-related protein n=1 Tax=Thermanaerothrix solaris TaxID=3058434 RepID=A0ABU3NIE6_9CHLR|nr:pilus assembly protein TadG-related protein [Thermanaerothrix sp. 4228-RoL]MDT8896640.1 pilus assembly protein TadG-related protein [Thermanaerothrix sp. 4228-RoL]
MCFHKPERGSSLAWAAVFLAVVVVPLMLLVGDGTRLWYVRTRLAQAADAACADVSWSVGDRLTWQRLRDDRYLANWYLVGRAQNTFYQMLAERTAVEYVPSLALSLDWDNARVQCRAQARARLTMIPNQEVAVRATIYARMRFATP